VEKKSNSLFGRAGCCDYANLKSNTLRLSTFFAIGFFPYSLFAVALFHTLCQRCMCVFFIFFYNPDSSPSYAHSHLPTYSYTYTQTHTHIYIYIYIRALLVLRKVLRRYRSADAWRTKQILISRKTKINVQKTV